MSLLRHGFTLVEMMVVIAVVGVLTVMVTLGVQQYQSYSRDSQREAKVTTLSEAFERYYQKNGEYPSVRTIVNTYVENTAEAVAKLLDVDQAALVMPQSSKKQSFVSTSQSPSSSTIVYNATSSTDNNNCQNVITGGCERFKLIYLSEDDGSITVESRHGNAP